MINNRRHFFILEPLSFQLQFFIYGGCGGTENQFFTKTDCNQLCGLRHEQLYHYRSIPYQKKECPARCRESLKRAYCGFDFMVRAIVVRFGPAYLTVRLVRVFKTNPKLPLRQMIKQDPGQLFAVRYTTACACPNVEVARQQFLKGKNDFILSGDFYGHTMMLNQGSYLALTSRQKGVKLQRYNKATCGKKKKKKGSGVNQRKGH